MTNSLSTLYLTGSLQIEKNRFFMVVNTYGTNGKRIQKWFPTGLETKNNKQRAKQMLNELLSNPLDILETTDIPMEITENEQVSAVISSVQEVETDIRYSDWVRQWLDEVQKRVDIITAMGYQSTAKAHVLPYFDEKGTALTDITRQTLQDYIDVKSENGRIDNCGGLSPASIRHLRNILNQSLKSAVQSNLLTSNPCNGLVLPKTERHEFNFYNQEQLAVLLEAVKNEPISPLIQVTAVYGLRRSELLGLKWDSVDFLNHTLTIKHTVVRQSLIVEKYKTKNASSHRTFFLAAEIEETLLRLKKAETENRKLLGKKYHANDYIFKRDNGEPYKPDYVSHKFDELLKKHSLPHIRFHDLRHSCASLLIAQGFTIKDVQEWLGHADITLTANLYTHLDLRRKQQMAQSITGSVVQHKVAAA